MKTILIIFLIVFMVACAGLLVGLSSGDVSTDSSSGPSSFNLTATFGAEEFHSQLTAIAEDAPCVGLWCVRCLGSEYRH